MIRKIDWGKRRRIGKKEKEDREEREKVRVHQLKMEELESKKIAQELKKSTDQQ